MKDHDVIARLRDLRRHREARAREAVIRRYAAARQAAEEVRKAAAAVAEHLQATADAEDAAFGSLVGHSVNAARLYRLQGRFETAARETEQLRENEREAGITEQRRRVELSAAREDHRKTMKGVTKLDRLLEDLIKRSAGRGLARAELSEEEERGVMRPSSER
ncbi:hypothetical protein EJ070_20275 [Mesorhizobium sp. M1E.F.Ca.ET.045.02.1.1]|uniref:hypothetical protein n=1 Tax=unclassified Mesorhizobium TaxID=325217 RepID=UPI000F7566CD|nr:MULTISPECIES: hypothetical protein [unclassified Mesorhizobium]AZO22759.1 hypothetical protein EJ070_20275 [Mesorhizobium sp. M1E.F.Ca.ET.045.02.1.1]RUW37589.1 hypothetical protein EOA38_03445 [Mesorhizobium sp. M1E.F.Ca.ET.041.01.1.1]RUW84065.1 hypothetical protein EOA29_10850 [Mesorhizobium sp. M1E.F.Ca.ET.063.01.1.1]RWB60727.1 MAG: hypothetical protein EOQ47_04320 [Mesorhizobium sp.]RWD88009.1 MAG: hypothetical protein EOS38_16420 [Mesorhizobium sp.]